MKTQHITYIIHQPGGFWDKVFIHHISINADYLLR